jgi:DNA-binding NtrC family response regulator
VFSRYWTPVRYRLHPSRPPGALVPEAFVVVRAARAFSLARGDVVRPASINIVRHSDTSAGPILVDNSRAMRQVRTLATRAAAGDAKVLITGESGVGKDVVARFIHARSTRSARPFVAVNCAAIADSLLETELFGHARGSFTGAYRDKMGRLELAHQGTIFLDEIGEMSLQMQAHLLRFLENGEIQPVGSAGGPFRINVRVISATNRDLGDLVATAAFRTDLLYRIKVIHIHVPPLRDRRKDLPALVDLAVARAGRPVRFSPSALQLMARYRWPGNVRELQNVVEQAAWMTDSMEVQAEDLPDPVRFASTDGLMPRRERRRQLADDLYSTLIEGHYTFWGDIHTLLMKRNITRHDLQLLVSRGLAATRGNYRAVVKLFGMPETDYKRFMNFLATHECTVDYREFRTPPPASPTVTPKPVRLPFEGLGSPTTNKRLPLILSV